ncbi:MAG: hypothetical protein MUO43_01720, partial [Desulfobacterales bacterium]|nr:hypothetical protein [Desulfobacterales bacterium]
PLELFDYFNKEAPEYNYGKKLRTSFDEDTSLPWIFNILLKFLKYISSHKIEALALFSTLMLIIILQSVLRRR